MHAIVDALEDVDVVGVTKEEVKTALAAYEEATEVVQNQAASVAKLYLAGDLESAVNANNGATKNIETLNAVETAYTDVLRRASDGLIDKRQQVVDGYSSISDTMFFVFIGVAALMIVVVNLSITKPAKGASGKLNEIITNIENGQGDLTERIQVKSQDEIGQLVSGVNNFIQQLQGIMLKIR